MYDAEKARQLLNLGYRLAVLLDGLGHVSVLATQDNLEDAVEDWVAYDSPLSPAESVFDGPNRYCGEGLTVAEALESVTEKVLHGRLPKRRN